MKHKAADVITKEEVDENVANGAEILGIQWVETDKNEHLKLDQKGSPDVVNPFRAYHEYRRVRPQLQK